MTETSIEAGERETPNKAQENPSRNLDNIGEEFSRRKRAEAAIFERHATEVSRAIELEQVYAEIYNLAWEAAEIETDSLESIEVKARLLEEYVDCPGTDIIHGLALSIAKDIHRIVEARQHGKDAQ